MEEDRIAACRAAVPRIVHPCQLFFLLMEHAGPALAAPMHVSPPKVNRAPFLYVTLPQLKRQRYLTTPRTPKSERF